MKKYKAILNDIQDDMQFEIIGSVEEVKDEIVNNLGLLSEDQFDTLLKNEWFDRSHITATMEELNG